MDNKDAIKAICDNHGTLDFFSIFFKILGDPNLLTEDLWSHFVVDHGAPSEGQQGRGKFWTDPGSVCRSVLWSVCRSVTPVGPLRPCKKKKKMRCSTPFRPRRYCSSSIIRKPFCFLFLFIVFVLT